MFKKLNDKDLKKLLIEYTGAVKSYERSSEFGGLEEAISDLKTLNASEEKLTDYLNKLKKG